MYKTLSTALGTAAFRLGLSLTALTFLTALAYQNWQLFSNIRIESLTRILSALSILLLLTFFNLFCETRKWQLLIADKTLTQRRAFIQVLSGMCSGFITPNRLGEFAGRIHNMPAEKRKRAVVMTFTGSTIQGTITVLFGIIGIANFPVFPYHLTDLKTNLLLISSVLLVGTILFFIYGNNPGMLVRFRLSLREIRSLRSPIVMKVFIFALFRYIIFSTQFVIALYFLGYEGSLFICYTGVFLLYFCQSYIPGTAFGELGIRELLAVFIFGSFLENPLLAAVAALLVWFANIAIPVLVGVFMGISLKHAR